MDGTGRSDRVSANARDHLRTNSAASDLPAKCLGGRSNAAMPFCCRLGSWLEGAVSCGPASATLNVIRCFRSDGLDAVDLQSWDVFLRNNGLKRQRSQRVGGNGTFG
jgi:hypothetical protein